MSKVWPTDQQTDKASYRSACPHLKITEKNTEKTVVERKNRRKSVVSENPSHSQPYLEAKTCGPSKTQQYTPLTLYRLHCWHCSAYTAYIFKSTLTPWVILDTVEPCSNKPARNAILPKTDTNSFSFQLVFPFFHISYKRIPSITDKICWSPDIL